MWCIGRRQNQRSWTTPNSVFKVTTKYYSTLNMSVTVQDITFSHRIDKSSALLVGVISNVHHIRLCWSVSGIGDIHKLALSFFPCVSHLRVASWFEFYFWAHHWFKFGHRHFTNAFPLPVQILACYRACKLLKFVSVVSMFLTISGGKQYVFGPIILIINRNWIGNRIFYYNK